MELYRILHSLDIDELKTVKKIATDLLKEKAPKRTAKTRDEKVADAVTKLLNKDYTFNYHELMYIFEVQCRHNGYPVTINIKDEVVFIKRIFGEKPPKGFGKFEVDVLDKYIESYDRLYKSETYPYPTLKGLGQSWIANKMIELVKIETSRQEVSELSSEVF